MKEGLLLVAAVLALTACPLQKTECHRVVKDLERELATLPSTCTKDSDCTCYVGGVSGVTKCGGASDLATAVRVGKLTEEYGSSHCLPVDNCAASLCTARCVSGRCSM